METTLRALSAGGGALLVLLVAVDVLQTTLLLHGGGPVATRLASALWRAALRRWGARDHRRLSQIGPQILLATIVVWALLFWIGWTALFCAEPNAVIEARSGQPAALAGRAYFVGYTLITLGIGDYRPLGAFWQLLTVIASASGFFFVTLVISYMVPLVSAVVGKRRLAVYISSLGTSVGEILEAGWNGRDYAGLATCLDNISPHVNQLAQQHLAYPVLHTFHSRQRRTAVAPSLAALDEALSVLEQLEPAYRPDPVSCRVFRRSLGAYLDTLGQQLLMRAEHPPPAPDAAALRACGIAGPRPEALQRSLDALAARRRLLLALVRRHGWAWSDVTGAAAPANR